MARLFIVSAPRSRLSPAQLAKTKLQPWERLVSAEVTSNGASVVIRTEDIVLEANVADVEAAPEPAPEPEPEPAPKKPRKKPGRKPKAKKAD